MSGFGANSPPHFPGIPIRRGIYGFQIANFFESIRRKFEANAPRKPNKNFKRAGYGANQAADQNGRKFESRDAGKVIRFLLRVGFWLTIVVLFLPADPAQREGSRAQVGTFEALGVAQAALEDAARFCARKPEACETGAQAFQTFGQKAQHGAKMLYEFLSDRFGDDHTASTPISSNVEPRLRKSFEQPGRDTLTPADVVPRWQGPEPKQVPMPPRRPA